MEQRNQTQASELQDKLKDLEQYEITKCKNIIKTLKNISEIYSEKIIRKLKESIHKFKIYINDKIAELEPLEQAQELEQRNETQAGELQAELKALASTRIRTSISIRTKK